MFYSSASAIQLITPNVLFYNRCKLWDNGVCFPVYIVDAAASRTVDAVSSLCSKQSPTIPRPRGGRAVAQGEFSTQGPD